LLEIKRKDSTCILHKKEINMTLDATEGQMHHLHQTFIQWFQEMFTGMDDWGSAYAERRWRIGLVHVQIGIGPQHVQQWRQ
jgi:hypothetical protein